MIDFVAGVVGNEAPLLDVPLAVPSMTKLLQPEPLDRVGCTLDVGPRSTSIDVPEGPQLGATCGGAGGRLGVDTMDRWILLEVHPDGPPTPAGVRGAETEALGMGLTGYGALGLWVSSRSFFCHISGLPGVDETKHCVRAEFCAHDTGIRAPGRSLRANNGGKNCGWSPPNLAPTNGTQGATDGGWRATDGGWRVTDGGCRQSDRGLTVSRAALNATRKQHGRLVQTALPIPAGVWPIHDFITLEPSHSPHFCCAPCGPLPPPPSAPLIFGSQMPNTPISIDTRLWDGTTEPANAGLQKRL